MFFWQTDVWQNMMQRKDALPHALLLRGRSGIGKHDFALSLSRALLCHHANATQQACGICPSCIWFTEGNHPDFRLVTPEDDDTEDDIPKKKTAKKSQISVLKIRQLFDYLSLSSHQVGGRRIVLISPAETLNTASANALLKMLEEPPERTLFLLVTSHPQRLLATIMSRCQTLDMKTPNRREAIHWLSEQGLQEAETLLDYAGGAPLLALQMQEQQTTRSGLVKLLSQGAKLDPFSTAPLLLALGMEQAIESLQKWVFDLINCNLTQQFHYHALYANALQALSKSVNLTSLLQLQKNLVEAKKTATHPLSNEMQLESLLLQYVNAFRN